MHRRLWGILLLLAGALACGSPFSPSERTRLAAAELRWASRGFGDYSIETSSSCFCPPELVQWARIEVVGGQVIRATLLGTGEVITDTRLAFWGTVEATFQSIRNANGDDGLDDVKVAFDGTLGFPTRIEWIPERGLLDAGGLQTMRDARPIS
jgi:hypothetical protein